MSLIGWFLVGLAILCGLYVAALATIYSIWLKEEETKSYICCDDCKDC